MALVKFAGTASDLDQPILDAKDVAPTDPIKIRLQPQVYKIGHGYQAWKRVSWALQFDTVGQAIAFRQVLMTLFALLGTVELPAIQSALDDLTTSK